MRLIGELERALAREESMFRAQLLREDLVRLRRLQVLRTSAPDSGAFLEAGMRIGWTPGDARTGELREPLEAFLRAVLADDEQAIVHAWETLHRARVERLLGCLSTPVPRPAD